MQDFFIPEFLELDNFTVINDEIGIFKYEIIVENEKGAKFRYTYDEETIELYKNPEPKIEEKAVGIINNVINYDNNILKSISSGFDSITSRLWSMAEKVINTLTSLVNTIVNFFKNLF